MNNRSIDIYLVRHGEAAGGWGDQPDPGLSALGRSQADAAALALQGTVSAESELFSSPLARARETAEPFGALVQRQIKVDGAFTEVPAPVPFSQRGQWLQAFMAAGWEGQPETLLAWRAGLIQRLLSLSSDAVVFTHFMVVNAVVGHIRDQSSTLCCRPDNGSITRIQRAEGKLALMELGREMQTHVG